MAAYLLDPSAPQQVELVDGLDHHVLARFRRIDHFSITDVHPDVVHVGRGAEEYEVAGQKVGNGCPGGEVVLVLGGVG